MPFVQAGDVKLHYIEQGSGDEPLVFIHGYTGSLNNWREALAHLPAHYRAIAFDLRGAGDSDKPPSGYGPEIYARDIDTATRTLGIGTFTLIGHSMGGVTAIQYAVLFPERLRRLVLVAPAPSGGITVNPTFREQTCQLRHNRPARRQLSRMMLVRPLADEVIERNIDDDLRWSDAAYEEAWQAMVSLQLSDALPHIQVPTLMIVGDRDMLRVANLDDAGRIPSCALHVFYRVGHLIPQEAPAEFISLVDDFVRHGVAAPLTWQDRAEALKTITA